MTQYKRRLPSTLLYSGFPIKILYVFLFFLCKGHITPPPSHYFIDFYNYIWLEVQTMQLLITQFSDFGAVIFVLSCNPR
jgi:hypothetical protein